MRNPSSLRVVTVVFAVLLVATPTTLVALGIESSSDGPPRPPRTTTTAPATPPPTLTTLPTLPPVAP